MVFHTRDDLLNRGDVSAREWRDQVFIVSSDTYARKIYKDTEGVFRIISTRLPRPELEISSRPDDETKTPDPDTDPPDPDPDPDPEPFDLVDLVGRGLLIDASKFLVSSNSLSDVLETRGVKKTTLYFWVEKRSGTGNFLNIGSDDIFLAFSNNAIDIVSNDTNLTNFSHTSIANNSYAFVSLEINWEMSPSVTLYVDNVLQASGVVLDHKETGQIPFSGGIRFGAASRLLYCLSDLTVSSEGYSEELSEWLMNNPNGFSGDNVIDPDVSLGVFDRYVFDDASSSTGSANSFRSVYLANPLGYMLSLIHI